MNKTVKYIKKHYLTRTAEEIAEELDLSPTHIRRLAKENGITKRIHAVATKGFKTIPGFSRYKISKNGMVVRTEDSILIKHTLNKDKYHVVKMVNDEGIRKTVRVHRMVALTYIPNPHNLPEVNHLNGKDDNHYKSLEWATTSENQKHAYATGLRRRTKGKDSPRSKYSEDTIRHVCEMIEQGYRNKDILKIIPEVNKTLITMLKSHRRWSHITTQYNI